MSTSSKWGRNCRQGVSGTTGGFFNTRGVNSTVKDLWVYLWSGGVMQEVQYHWVLQQLSNCLGSSLSCACCYWNSLAKAAQCVLHNRYTLALLPCCTMSGVCGSYTHPALHTHTVKFQPEHQPCRHRKVKPVKFEQ